MSNTKSNQKLTHLPQYVDIEKAMLDVSMVWDIAGFSSTLHMGNRMCLIVHSGSIALSKEEDGYELLFLSFPHDNVKLRQLHESGSWEVVQGSKSAQKNAVKMTEIFFMNADTLFAYSMRKISKHNMRFDENFTIEKIRAILPQ